MNKNIKIILKTLDTIIWYTFNFVFLFCLYSLIHKMTTQIFLYYKKPSTEIGYEIMDIIWQLILICGCRYGLAMRRLEREELLQNIHDIEINTRERVLEKHRKFKDELYQMLCKQKHLKSKLETSHPGSII